MSKFLNFLAIRPEIGAVPSIGGITMPFIESIMPIFQLVGVIVGITVGVLTIISIIKKNRK